mmetsp:Transcript_7725/g.19689  ORF Transcript_7725/g.19689 Transcript_7725/m.19689 type:complete len:138 (-) Transcript_7725:36-449(-)
MVNDTDDWKKLDTWGLQQGLELTLRQSAAGTECAMQGDTICVSALLRFGGAPFAADASITTFAADGTKTGITISHTGVTTLMLPFNRSQPSMEVYASANYRQPTPGEYQGKQYVLVDHWTTTYARLMLPESVDSLVV